MEVKGNTLVNDNVFLTAAQIVLQDMEDVVKGEKKRRLPGISKIFAEKSAPQIAVKKMEPEKGAEYGRVAYELKFTVLYGAKIPVLVADIRKQLIQDIEEMTGYKVEKVDITVEKVVEAHELQNEEVDSLPENTIDED